MLFKAKLAITIAVTAIAAELSRARELRPSDHGLEFQTTPPEAKFPPEMEQFFGNFGSPPPVAFSWAMQSNDTSWWRSINRGRGIGGNASHVLLVVSLGCGAVGACLLVVSGLVYLFCKDSKGKKGEGRKRVPSCFSAARSEEDAVTGNNNNSGNT